MLLYDIFFIITKSIFGHQMLKFDKAQTERFKEYCNNIIIGIAIKCEIIMKITILTEISMDILIKKYLKKFLNIKLMQRFYKHRF